MIQRRPLLFGLAAALSAPTPIPAQNIMPVRVWKPSRRLMVSGIYDIDWFNGVATARVHPRCETIPELVLGPSVLVRVTAQEMLEMGVIRLPGIDQGAINLVYVLPEPPSSLVKRALVGLPPA